MSRPKAYFMNGGQGRVISSIPAFEKLAEKDDDFIIVCESGTDFYKGHPKLHKKAFDVWHKRLFEDYLKNMDCVAPEPYRVWEYYNQKCSIAQAFDIAINNEGVRELPDPKLYLNKMEVVSGFNVVEEVKATTGLDKVLVIQPFGRTAQNMGEFIVDPTSRSFQLNNIIDIINELKKDYAVIVMTEFPFVVEENSKYPIAMPQIPDLRVWAGIIDVADHFLGCDSMGQHMAKALGKTVTSVIGSTFPVNISYPDDPDVDIIDLGAKNGRTYSPIRLTAEEDHDRVNDEVMEMDEDDIKLVLGTLRKRLGKPKQYTGDHKAQAQQQNVCPTHGVVHEQTKQPAQILGRSGS